MRSVKIMKIDLTRLKSGFVSFIAIDENCVFDESYLQQAELLELNNVHVVGEISKDAMDDYELSVIVDGVMVLPCAITLKPVNYPFEVEIQGNLQALLSEIDENIKILENSIDLLPIIWENILMEIPIRIVSDDISDVKTRGEGWELITEDKNPVNPNLAKLKDLL